MATPSSPRQTFASSRKERVVVDAYDAFRFTATDGVTWLRVLPPHADSKLDEWLYTFKVWDLAPRSAGLIPEVAVPSSLSHAPKVQDRVEIFARYVDANYPHLVHTANSGAERGLSLWPKDRGICAVYVAKSPAGKKGECAVRFWYGSYYNGNNALRPGVLRTLANLASETIPSFSGKPTLRYGDISHPTTGRLVALSINRNPLSGYQFDSLRVAEEQRPLALDEATFAAHPDYAKCNVPLESVIRCPSADELKELLENYLCWQVRHGYVNAEVFVAYANCFGEEIPAAKRTIEESKTSEVATPEVRLPLDTRRTTPTTVPSPETPRKFSPKIVDDLAAGLDTIIPESKPAVEVLPTPVAPPPANPCSDEMTQFLDELRALRKAPPAALANKQNYISELRLKLLFRYSSKLSLADMDLLDSFTPPDSSIPI